MPRTGPDWPGSTPSRQRAMTRDAAGLPHGLDEGDPELFYLCPSERLRVGRA
ncbi:hypothetical protein [Streptomyces ureilyticus]|uniref:Uncharacterized protein n=1 Tax=Streptomyces ureilyticus TaxID=1775131 RepID=A0ABX0E4X6_9ACTN|nr:hypothetical protein [Streptomyces ureilyticus]NGO47618.1 hypothetical protein [Streptomyces ureilyticus]